MLLGPIGASSEVDEDASGGSWAACGWGVGNSNCSEALEVTSDAVGIDARGCFCAVVYWKIGYPTCGTGWG